MIVIFLISLGVIIYHIGVELDRPAPAPIPLQGNCPTCRELVESGWLVCPHCQTILRKPCPECRKVHDLWVDFCPWCGSTGPERVP